MVITVWHVTAILGSYFMMTFLLPAVLFRRSMRHMPFGIRFLAYQVCGNFCMIGLVWLLQYIQCADRVMLLVFTLLPSVCIFLALQIHRKKQARLQEEKRPRRPKRIFWNGICKNLPETLLTGGLVLAVVMIYGSAAGVTACQNGYVALSQGCLPKGTAGAAEGCIIYYLQTVFGIKAEVLLQCFPAVQTLTVYLAMLAFLRLCCRLRYLAYAGVSGYLLAGTCLPGTWFGAAAAKPQEFSVVFMLAALAALFLFWKQIYLRLKETLGNEDEPQEEVRVYLLDDVLAESAAREEACKAARAAGAEPEAEPEEALILLDEDAQGAFSLKKCVLDGTVSVKESQIYEIVGHAIEEEIPEHALDKEQKKGKKGRHAADSGTAKVNIGYLILFCAALGLSLIFSGVLPPGRPDLQRQGEVYGAVAAAAAAWIGIDRLLWFIVCKVRAKME